MNLKRLSPLRYPGGKAKVLDYIIELIKQNNCLGSEYVEPYASGAGVALGLLIGGYVSKIHINDFDLGIYSFWKSILDDTDLFIEKIEKNAITIEEWEKQKNIYNNLENFTQLEQGFATFFLNRCNRSGIITAGCIGGKHQNGNYELDARFNKINLIERIKLIASFRDSIHLYNCDTLSLLKEQQDNFKQMVLYLDPPYYVKGFSLYRNFYKHQDHLDIANELRKLNGNWVVSYDNVPQIIDIYSGVKKREFSINYSAGETKRGSEIMFFSNNLLIPTQDVIKQ